MIEILNIFIFYPSSFKMHFHSPAFMKCEVNTEQILKIEIFFQVYKKNSISSFALYTCKRPSFYRK